MINGHKDKYGSKFTLHYKVGVGELIAQLVTLAHMDMKEMLYGGQTA